jgi:hypothetical protein
MREGRTEKIQKSAREIKVVKHSGSQNDCKSTSDDDNGHDPKCSLSVASHFFADFIEKFMSALKNFYSILLPKAVIIQRPKKLRLIKKNANLNLFKRISLCYCILPF